MKMQRIARGLLAGGTLLALVAAPAAATEAASWAGVKNAIVSQLPDGTTLIGFSAEALERAGKKPVEKDQTAAVADAPTAADLSAEEVRTVSRWFKPKGKSQLAIFDQNDSGDGDDDLQVHLHVPNGAVDQTVLITMTVYGNRLSDLVIAFQPGGLVFNTDAALQILLGPNLVDLDAETISVWHEYGDGTVEETSLAAYVSKGSGYLEINAAVSGFSRYGIRRGDR